MDLKEAENLCGQIERLERDGLQRLLMERDRAKMEWLQSFLNGELYQILNADKYDLQNHIES